MIRIYAEIECDECEAITHYHCELNERVSKKLATKSVGWIYYKGYTFCCKQCLKDWLKGE